MANADAPKNIFLHTCSERKGCTHSRRKGQMGFFTLQVAPSPIPLSTQCLPMVNPSDSWYGSTIQLSPSPPRVRQSSTNSKPK